MSPLKRAEEKATQSGKCWGPAGGWRCPCWVRGFKAPQGEGPKEPQQLPVLPVPMLQARPRWCQEQPLALGGLRNLTAKSR